MSETAINVAGLILSVVGTLALIPTLYVGVSYNLPARKYEKLRELYTETNDLFHEVSEGGLLPDTGVVRSIQRHLDKCRYKMDRLRADVYSATTFKRRCRALYDGLLWKIFDVHNEVHRVRALILSTSEKERERLEDLKAQEYLLGDSGVNSKYRADAKAELSYTFPTRPPPIHSNVAVSRILSVERNTPLEVVTVVDNRRHTDGPCLIGRESSSVSSAPLSLPSNEFPYCEAHFPSNLISEETSLSQPFGLDTPTVIDTATPAFAFATLSAPPNDRNIASGTSQALHLAQVHDHLLLAAQLIQQIQEKEL
ncbi:hypothetical protein K474DRAFT_1661260 [Panus rudis PR-1116 ss-1]|nr:hypothetical protein K474DRAFT_1661260 [Panus rudis PR-1116 ss-1]